MKTVVRVWLNFFWGLPKAVDTIKIITASVPLGIKICIDSITEFSWFKGRNLLDARNSIAVLVIARKICKYSRQVL